MKSILSLLILYMVAIASEPALDGIVAQVNTDVITFSEVHAKTAADERALRKTLAGQNLVDAIKKLRASQLDPMIDRLLLLQELKRQAHPLPEDATDEQIDAAIRDGFSSDRQQWMKRLKPAATIKKF